MNILRLSWKNMMYRPWQTALSVILFAVSIGLNVFLLLFNHQLKSGLDRNLAEIDLVIGAKGSPLQLILNSMYHVDAPTGNISLQEAAPFLNPQHPLIGSAIPLSLGDSYGAYRIAGTPPSILNLYGVKQVFGDVYEHDFEALIGSVVAHALNLHIGDSFHSTHGLLDDPDMAHDHGSAFEVTGILPATGTVLDQLILCTPRTIWKVHEHDSTSTNDEEHPARNHVEANPNLQALDTAYVQVVSDSIIADLRRHPEKEVTGLLIRFKNKTSIQALNFLRNINVNTNLMAASPALELNRLYAMVGNSTEAIRYIALLMAMVAAISIFISLYTALKERKYEMAIMRISGASPFRLFQLIVIEGVWIATLGLLLGLCIGHIGMQLAGQLLEKTYKYHFHGFIWIPQEWGLVIGALLLGKLAAVIPAIRGARINLHETLADM